MVLYMEHMSFLFMMDVPLFAPAEPRVRHLVYSLARGAFPSHTTNSSGDRTIQAQTPSPWPHAYPWLPAIVLRFQLVHNFVDRFGW